MIKDEEESTVNSSLWTWEEDKVFESAVADTPEDCVDRWEKIADAVPGRTIEELKYHYELLVEDINNIESGCVPLPRYTSYEDGTDHVGESGATKNGGSLGHNESKHGGGKGSRADQERRKGVAWTEDEHRLFLLGLEKFGKGDWRSISRNFVVSRTPTQVASHAQKYFIRLNSMNKDRRRSSIHDITSVGNRDEAVTQRPITGQSNAPTACASSGKSSKQPQPGPGVSLYGATTLGQPVGGPAVGTPVHLHSTGHMAYGVRPPVPMLPGTPTNMAPTTYSMPHASAHM